MEVRASQRLESESEARLTVLSRPHSYMGKEFKEFKDLENDTLLTELSEEVFLQYKIGFAALWFINGGYHLRVMLPALLEYGDTTDIVKTFEFLEKFDLTESIRPASYQITEKGKKVLSEVFEGTEVRQG